MLEKRPYTIDEIIMISKPVERNFGVRKLALFGSYARRAFVRGIEIWGK
jgi:predicted nucleotidyltransferase